MNATSTTPVLPKRVQISSSSATDSLAFYSRYSLRKEEGGGRATWSSLS
jgi:hypothetical protein